MKRVLLQRLLHAMIEEEQQSQQLNNNEQQFRRLPPQIKIYNRNFYLRNAKQQDLEQETNREIQELASKPKITPNSYILLVQQLDQRLTHLIAKHAPTSPHLDFPQFQLILDELTNSKAISKEEDKFEVELAMTQFWLWLVGYDLEQSLVPVNNVVSLMHILFCPYALKKQEMLGLVEHTFPNLQENRSKYCESFPQHSDQVLQTDELVKLWLRIKRNLIFCLGNEKKDLPKQDQPSFRPEISMKSREYAKKDLEKYLSNHRLDNVATSKLNELSGYISGEQELSYHDLLYRRTLQKESLLKTSRQKASENKTNGKTLTVEQTKQLVENLYIVKEKPEDIDYSKIQEDKELKLCTFQPTTTEYRKRSTTPTIKNYSKEVDRLEKGRQNKQKLKEAYENLGRVKAKTSGPPSMVEREKPKLILEIKVGEQLVKLKLKGDQQPKIVAKKFVMKHGLEDSMQQVLQEIVSQQLASL